MEYTYKQEIRIKTRLSLLSKDFRTRKARVRASTLRDYKVLPKRGFVHSPTSKGLRKFKMRPRSFQLVNLAAESEYSVSRF